MLPAIRRRRAMTWTDPIDTMRHEFDRLLNLWADEAGVEGPLAGEYPMDIREDEQNVFVDAELPGFKKDQINVSIEQGVLTISAERKPEEFKGTKHLHERRYTRVQRSVSLPSGIDESNVDARFSDGVLSLRMKKSKEALPHRIEVR